MLCKPNSDSKRLDGVTRNMLRIVQQMSRKAIFITLFGVCLMGGCIVYITEIKVVTSRLSYITYSELLEKDTWLHLKSTEISNNRNIIVEEDTIDQNITTSIFLNRTPSENLRDQHHGHSSDNGKYLKNIYQNTTRSLLIAQANTSSKISTPEVLSNTTTMTFNTSFIVHCKESPYTECIPPNLKPIPGKIVKITYLRRPHWLPKSDLDVTRCEVNQCVIHETELTNDTDIVVVYGVGLKDNFRVPQRSQHQLSAIHIMEPPMHTYADFITNVKSPWNKRINLIMSYRVDGDAFLPYNRLRFQPKPLHKRPNYYEIAKNKTRTAVWIVSHCETASKRESYVREMQKYIDVDILGGCGIPCSKDNACNDWPSKYKFYLSFENSLCTDYVTEKFFKLYNPNIFVIPVVRGGADYDKHFPNFTYINSAHFTTPKDLALHIKYLASDLPTYSKYLEYKDLYRLVPYTRIGCKMCAYVHTHKLPEKSQIYNLTSWLGDEHCHIPRDVK